MCVDKIINIAYRVKEETYSNDLSSQKYSVYKELSDDSFKNGYFLLSYCFYNLFFFHIRTIIY